MIEIEKSYGNFTMKLPEGKVINYNNIDELIEHCKAIQDNFEMQTTKVTTYVFDDETITEAMDLTILASMLTWGKQLYSGDCIKLTIKAEYCPENK